MIYMQIAETKGMIYDSALVRNGRFVFRGKLNSPERMLLYIKGLPYNIPICLENDNYRIVAESGSLRDAKISGGESQELFNLLNIKNKEVIKKYNLNELLPEFINPVNDSLRNSELNLTLNFANSEMRKFNDSLMKANPTSFYSLLNLYDLCKVGDYYDILDKVKDFNNNFQNNKYYKKIHETLKTRESLLPGKIAPDLTLININGKTFHLKDLFKKNQKTILIFWSSWNNESYQFIKLYINNLISNNWNLKNGFITISVNDEVHNWRRKILEENIDATHLIEYSVGEAVNKYNLELIPQMFIIDNKGIIKSSDNKMDVKSVINSTFNE